ncbi:MAG: hypothetical protein J7L56_06405, partial [Halomonas sp.]
KLFFLYSYVTLKIITKWVVLSHGDSELMSPGLCSIRLWEMPDQNPRAVAWLDKNKGSNHE